jgi:hypothetical protein
MQPHSPSPRIIRRWTFAAIEAKTGLDFLQKLPVAEQAAVEGGKAKAIWK